LAILLPQRQPHQHFNYPKDIAHIYGMDRLRAQGEGMKVLLIEAYDTYQQSDLQRLTSLIIKVMHMAPGRAATGGWS